MSPSETANNKESEGAAGEGERTRIVCKIKMIVLKNKKKSKKSVETWYSHAQVTWEFLGNEE